MKEFPLLINGDMNWKVIIDGNKVIRQSWKTTKNGKGKVREYITDSLIDPEIDAQRYWDNQKKKGYHELQEEIKIYPMLAQKYQGKLFEHSCVQPKLDGIRCIYENGELYTRTREIIPNFQQIKNELKRLNLNLIFDGELYCHELPFEEVEGIVMTKNSIHPREDEISYYIFDVIDEKKTFRERTEKIKRIQSKYLKFVDYTCIQNEDELKKYHEIFLEQGYEGSIIRDLDSFYVCKRSKSLLKHKDFQDKEFEIVDVVYSDSCTENGCAIYVCKTDIEDEFGTTFNVRPRGSLEDRRKIKKEDVVGKWLTVRFQEMTKDMIPRFPVGIVIRKDF